MIRIVLSRISMGSYGKPVLPGQKTTGWQTRNPKLPEGFSRTSAEGRLLLYFQQRPGQVCTDAELMAENGIPSLQALRKTISELRAVISPRIIKLNDGYIYEEP